MFFTNFIAIDRALQPCLIRLREDLSDEKSAVKRMTIFI